MSAFFGSKTDILRYSRLLFFRLVLSRDEMGNRWLIATQKTPNGFLEHAIGFVTRSCCRKCSSHDFKRNVSKKRPSFAASSKIPQAYAPSRPLSTKLFERCEETLAITWRDLIFNRHKHRSAVVLDFMTKYRCRPMHRWCEIISAPV